MASLVEELVSVLEQELHIYKQLAELGEQKRQILIQSDVPSLEKLTVLEQEASTELLAFSNKQTELLNDIATVLGKNPQEITVTRLIGFLEEQPEIRQKLSEARDQLIETAELVNRQNELNGILIHQAMELLEFDISLFKIMRQAPETANYDRNAYNTGMLLGNSGFDAKQ